MQYILTKEEYNDLVPKTKYHDALGKIEKLNKQVLELSKYNCVKLTQGNFGYCDFCPITATCFEIKRFSK
jgi:hypothetical protein